MTNHQLAEQQDSEDVADTDDNNMDELDDNPQVYPGTCLRRFPWDPAPGPERKATESGVGTTKPKPISPGSPEAPGPVYAREKYNAEKDAMIRFLRDNLENTWPNVATLYDEYWGYEVGARKLARRYAAIVPKDQQGKKRVGRLTTGDKEMGLKGGKYWDWMTSWEAKGSLK
jgi:hypothetical protein